MYIDKEEIVWPPGEPPNYSTRTGISSEYSFMMRGTGAGAGEMRVAGRRYSCWCPACSVALESGEGMDSLLDIRECERHKLTQFSEGSIYCTAASGVANARARQKVLWSQLKPLLKAGKFAAVQVCSPQTMFAHGSPLVPARVSLSNCLFMSKHHKVFCHVCRPASYGRLRKKSTSAQGISGRVSLVTQMVMDPRSSTSSRRRTSTSLWRMGITIEAMLETACLSCDATTTEWQMIPKALRLCGSKGELKF